MRADYHMHFEKGSYDEEWVEGFFHQAELLGLEEIGISEHSHTFPEFESLYYDDFWMTASSASSRKNGSRPISSNIPWTNILPLWQS